MTAKEMYKHFTELATPGNEIILKFFADGSGYYEDAAGAKHYWTTQGEFLGVWLGEIINP